MWKLLLAKYIDQQIHNYRSHTIFFLQHFLGHRIVLKGIKSEFAF